MGDTNVQECNCCQIETDCINGLCEMCSDYNYKLQKQSDLLTLGLLQEKQAVVKLQAENEKYLDCLKMILRRACCSPLNNPYCDGGDCDCVWERVCQTIDPKRWEEVQALQGKKGM